MNKVTVQTQGVDPLGHVWTTPAVFVSDTEWHMGFTRSKLLCAAAAARRSLYDALVCDIGCGFGATAAAIAGFGPREIHSIDKSAEMVQYLKTILTSDQSVNEWLREEQADLVLNDFNAAVHTLETARREFKTSWFTQRGGDLKTGISSVLELLSLETLRKGKVFDVIIGNNAIAWPIGEVKQKLPQTPASVNRAAMAIETVLKPLIALTKNDGVIAVSVTKDFVVDDLNHKRDVELQYQTFVAHPLYDEFHELLADVMFREFSLPWQTPTTESLFTVSDFVDAAKRLGCSTHVVPIEVAFPGSPVNAFMAQLPKIIGKFDLNRRQKIALLERVHKHVRPAIENMTTSHPEFGDPALSENFCFILEKRS